MKKISICFLFILLFSGCASEKKEQKIIKEKETVPSENLVEKNTLLQNINNEVGYFFIAHGLGTVEGVGASNTREALENSYANGFKIFEVDLSLTKDGKIVVFHEGREEAIGHKGEVIGEIKEKEFLKQKFLDKYTLLSFDDFLQYVQDHKDMYVVTDVKGNQLETFKKIIENPIIKENPEIMKRIIPQIYEVEELSSLLTLYPFSDIIFTLYRTKLGNLEILDALEANPQITAVTMWWDSRYTDYVKGRIEQLGKRVYVHTVNDQKKIFEFINKGVGVYTDDFNVNVLANL